LEALVGDEPPPALVDAALATIPAAELPDALQVLARAHGSDALGVLVRCLRGRPAWAVAAAPALATLATSSAAEALRAAEPVLATKAARTAVRRALYRLRQIGVVPPGPGPRAAAPPPRPVQAWMSAVDGTGTRGLWLLLEGPLGAHTGPQPSPRRRSPADWPPATWTTRPFSSARRRCSTCPSAGAGSSIPRPSRRRRSIASRPERAAWWCRTRSRRSTRRPSS